MTPCSYCISHSRDMLSFLNGKSKSITGAAMVLAAASFLSRFIGIFRERIFASQFGTGDLVDAYVAAFRIPDLLYMLLVMGALSAGFIPVFTSLWQKDTERAWRLVSTALNILGIVLIIVSGVLIVFAPAVTAVIVPGFSPEKMELTTRLMRVIFISPIILGLSAIVSGVLQSLHYFVIYALTPILYNLGIIAGAVFLVPYFGPMGLAYGVLIGALLHLCIQLPALWRAGFRWRHHIDWRMKELHQIIRIMVPRAIGLGATQFTIIALTSFASTFSVGALAIFHYANNLQSFPVGIIGISFAIAAFPTLSALAAKGDIESFVSHVSATLRQVIFFMVLLTVYFLLLRAQITRVVLGTGAFDWNATIATGDALALFSLSLIPQAILPLLQRAFYALHDARTPLTAAITGLIATIGLAYGLANHTTLGIAGIALAFSLGVTVQVIVLWWLLRRQVGSLGEAGSLRAIYTMVGAGLVAGIAVQVSKTLVGMAIGTETFWAVFTQLVVPATIGALVYGGILYAFKSPEMVSFVAAIRSRLFKNPGPTEELTNTTSANE